MCGTRAEITSQFRALFGRVMPHAPIPAFTSRWQNICNMCARVWGRGWAFVFERECFVTRCNEFGVKQTKVWPEFSLRARDKWTRPLELEATHKKHNCHCVDEPVTFPFNGSPWQVQCERSEAYLCGSAFSAFSPLGDGCVSSSFVINNTRRLLRLF